MKPEDFASGDTMDVSTSGDGATIDASDESLGPRRPVRITGPNSSSYEKLLTVDPAHYTMSTELARGGMGRIVRAFDRRLGRPVAIKELLTGHDDIRFEREARITARLAHPAIVAIHEAGRWPTGEPFFAMKLVAGQSLDKRITETKSFADRLALIPSVIAVVEALAYAHSERVIHRDLKPANVLVGNYGETVVIDWGLAKDLATPEDDVAVGPYRGGREGETIDGAVMGTPAYMPPEQADGERVDERADVYALGALLYQVLAGVAPYEGKTSAEVLTRVLAGPPKPLAELVPQAPIELVAIVDKAMARKAADRFPSAQEMADELRRFQTGQLVTSHRYTSGELVRRWLRKYRAPVAVGAIAFVTLAIVGVASIAKILAETHRADREAADARARADRGTLERARALLDTDPTQAIAVLTELSPNAPEWRAARTIVSDAEARGVAHIYRANGEAIRELGFSPDGAYLAARTDLGLIVWDVATGVAARRLGGFQTFAWVGHDVVNVDGAGELTRWHPFAGGVDRIATFAAADARLSPNGRYLAYRDDPLGPPRIRDLETQQEFETYTGDAFDWLNDHLLATWDSRYQKLVVTSARTRQSNPVSSPHDEQYDSHPVRAFAASADELYIADNSNTLNHVGNSPITTGHKTPITAMVVLPDGRVATATSVSTEQPERLEVVDEADLSISLADGTKDVARLVGHRSSITALTCSRSGMLASGDLGGEVRIWHRTPVAARRDRRHSLFAFLEPDRNGVVEMRAAGNATRTDLVTGKSVSIERTLSIKDGKLPPHGERPLEDDDSVAASALVHAKHTLRWLTIDHEGEVWAWDFTTGARQICNTASGEGCGAATTFAISGDGQVGAAFFGSLEIFDTSTGSVIERKGGPIALALTDAGARIAVAERNSLSNLYVLDHTDHEPLDLARHTPPSALAFSNNDQQLAAAVDDSIELISLTPPYATQTLIGHHGMITSLEFLPDGRLVSTSIDHTVRIWNVGDGSSHVLRLPARIATVDVLGDTAVTTSDDHVLRVWDIPSESERPLAGHDGPPIFGGIAADGRIVGVDHDGRVSQYQPTIAFDEPALRTWIAALTNL